MLEQQRKLVQQVRSKAEITDPPMNQQMVYISMEQYQANFELGSLDLQSMRRECHAVEV